MKAIEIYTDGACSGNPGRAAGASCCCTRETRRNSPAISPRPPTTAWSSLPRSRAWAALREPCEVTLYSDSSYLINAFEKHWLDNWQRNGWKTSSKSPVENQDLWKLLLLHVKNHRVRFVKVKGSQRQCLQQPLRRDGRRSHPQRTRLRHWGEGESSPSQKTTFAKRWTPQEREGRNFGRSILS